MGYDWENGQYDTPTHTEVSVGSSTTVVLAENNDRRYALFQNDSDEDIYLMFGASAEMNKGIRLLADGLGTFEMSQAIGNLYRGAINAICTSGTKNLLVLEGS